MKRQTTLVPIIIVLILLTLRPGAAQNNQAEDLAAAKLFDRTVQAIERNYVDPSRIQPKKMLDGAFDNIQKTIPEVFIKDLGGGSIKLAVGLADRQFSIGIVSSLDDVKRVIHEIFPFIAENYHGDTPTEEIEYAAINGMLDILDPHSMFMPPKLYKEFQVGTRGKFGGLGIVISVKDGQLTVMTPIEGTPASRAGIKSGDRILQIDDESTINMSLTDAVNMLRGDVGTKVSIVIEPTGAPPRKISLTRAIINIESVQSRMFAQDASRIGYLRVKDFQANTDADVKRALQGFHQNGAKVDGLILDLRNNPGGLLDVAVSLTDHFLRDGVIVTTVGPNNQVVEKETAKGTETEENYPLIVLVNEGSASASEIVAGALQTNNRAVVVGRKTFGKGSVQTVFEIGKGSALKITIAQYKPAGTQDIQLVGVIPDINLQPVTVDKEAMNLIEDVIPNEADLEQHLDGRQLETTKEQSKYRARFLQPKESEKELEAKSTREYNKGIDLEKDFAVEMARRLLVKTKSGTRQEQLTQMEPVLKIIDKEQQTVINQALAKQGIDWTIGQKTGVPAVGISYEMKLKGVSIKDAQPGKKIDLVLTATNTGTGPYYRLIAVGQADWYFLSNKEFPFGRINPNETKHWSVPIELPESLVKQQMVMGVTFEDVSVRPPDPLNVAIPIADIAQPSFAFGFTTLGFTQGKPIPKGVPITVNMDILNTGTGASSKDTIAALSNECGDKLFIEKGRVKLGAIPPKGVKKALFKFHLTGEPDKAACPLKLQIADMKRYIFLTKKIDFIVNGGTVKPPAGQKYSPPVVEITKAPASTAEIKADISGTITDTDRIRDYFVFVGDKKTAYVPNATGANTLPFTITVPLEPGPNQVAVIAEDELELAGRKFLVIERTSGERKKDKRTKGAMFVPGMQP